MNTRLLAANIIDAVLAGRSLTEELQQALPRLSDARDRAFVQAICYGVCRYYTRLDVLLSFLLEKPMKAKDSDVYTLLLVGLYQLIYMRVPEHAAVAETVNATATLKKAWSRGFVNAILREYLRERVPLEAKLHDDEEAKYAHPSWWIHKIRHDWPAQWEAILAANDEHPPLTLRANVRQATREQYLEKSSYTSLAQILPETRSGFIMPAATVLEEMPGFATGAVTVQDGAAQLAAALLALAPGQRVLDACAAPGGKLTHLLELEPKLAACVAVEKSQERMLPIHDNLKRAQLTATCICADANEVSSWWDGEYFDRILLDAPCTASGVVRRHPDIKLLRLESDIQACAATQLQLLEALWPLLKPGGLFVYATCSVFPEENTGVMEAFLRAHPEGVEKKIQADWGVPCAVGRQILPGMHEMDGFYYAVLENRLAQ